MGIISGSSEQTEKKIKSSVEEIVCGKTPSHNGSNLVMYPYHVLKEMGYAPEILEEECAWEYCSANYKKCGGWGFHSTLFFKKRHKIKAFRMQKII